MDADVLDIEPGNNDAAGAVPWVKAKWERGDTPTVYCFSDGGPAGYRISDVRAACDAAGVRRPLFWIAQWDKDPATFDPAGDPEIIGKTVRRERTDRRPLRRLSGHGDMARSQCDNDC